MVCSGQRRSARDASKRSDLTPPPRALGSQLPVGEKWLQDAMMMLSCVIRSKETRNFYILVLQGSHTLLVI